MYIYNIYIHMFIDMYVCSYIYMFVSMYRVFFMCVSTHMHIVIL